MSIKKKTITVIIGIEAVIITVMITFLFYMNSDTVKINRQLELAQRYLLDEDYEQAIAAYEIIIEIDPRNVDAYLGLAETYAAADDLENAVKILEKATEQTNSDEILAMMERYTTKLEQKKIMAQMARETEMLAASTELAEPETPNISAIDAAQQVIENQSESSANSEEKAESLNKLESQENVDTEETELQPNTAEIPEQSEGLTERVDCGNGFYAIYTYDSKGKQIKEEHEIDGRVAEYGVYIYDSGGNLIKEEWYTEDGSLENYYVYIYDSEGKLIKEELHEEDGSLFSYGTYIYDSERKLIKEQWQQTSGDWSEVFYGNQENLE